MVGGQSLTRGMAAVGTTSHNPHHDQNACARQVGHDARAVYNRIPALMAHTTYYAFKGASRLAADAGISKSALSRLICGQSSPSFALICALTRAFERRLQRPIDPRELVSFDGAYPTAYVCELVGCKGCLPTEAYAENDTLKPEFKAVKPGQWPPLPASIIQEGA